MVWHCLHYHKTISINVLPTCTFTIIAADVTRNLLTEVVYHLLLKFESGRHNEGLCGSVYSIWIRIRWIFGFFLFFLLLFLLLLFFLGFFLHDQKNNCIPVRVKTLYFQIGPLLFCFWCYDIIIFQVKLTSLLSFSFSFFLSFLAFFLSFLDGVAASSELSSSDLLRCKKTLININYMYFKAALSDFDFHLTLQKRLLYHGFHIIKISRHLFWYFW